MIHFPEESSLLKRRLRNLFIRRFSHIVEVFEDSLEWLIEWWEPMSQKNLVKLAFRVIGENGKHFSFLLLVRKIRNVRRSPLK